MDGVLPVLPAVLSSFHPGPLGLFTPMGLPLFTGTVGIGTAGTGIPGVGTLGIGIGITHIIIHIILITIIRCVLNMQAAIIQHILHTPEFLLQAVQRADQVLHLQ